MTNLHTKKLKTFVQVQNILRVKNSKVLQSVISYKRRKAHEVRASDCRQIGVLDCIKKFTCALPVVIRAMPENKIPLRYFGQFHLTYICQGNSVPSLNITVTLFVVWTISLSTVAHHSSSSNSVNK